MLKQIFTSTYEEHIARYEKKVRDALLYNIWTYLYYRYHSTTMDIGDTNAINIVRNEYHR